MKENQSVFGGKMSEKYIDTPSLLIKNNIMTWDNTVIQLSNISYISAADIALMKFPGWLVAVIIAALFLLGEQTLSAILLIAGCAAGLYLWYRENEKRRQGAILTIRMNSGHILHFTFKEKEFLIRVVRILESIIINGGVNSPVSINIKGCTITNSRVLSDINI